MVKFRIVTNKYIHMMIKYKTLIFIIISSLALIISLYTAGLFSSFDLKIYIDGYLLPKTTLTGDSSDTFPIALPIIFTNKGMREGIIKDVILVVKNIDTGEKSVYSPITEIDLNKYITDKRALHADNIIAPNFYPFSLSAKEMKTKTFLFTLDQNIKGNSLSKTNSGKYSIKIYIKTTKKDYYKINEFNVDFNINQYNSGGSVYLGRINFPYSTFNLNSLDK